MLCGGMSGRSIASEIQLSPMKNRITKSNVFELDIRWHITRSLKQTAHFVSKLCKGKGKGKGKREFV